MERGAFPQQPSALDEFIAAYEAARARDGATDLADFLPASSHPLYQAVLRELVRIDLEYGWTQGRPRRLDHYLHLFPALLHDPESLQAISFEEYRLRQQAGERPSAAEYHERFGVGVADWPQPAGAATPLVDAAPPADERILSATRILPPEARSLQGANAYRRFLQHEGQTDGAAADFEFASGIVDLDALLGKSPDVSPRPGAEPSGKAAVFPPVGSDFLGFHLVDELGRGAFGKVFLARQGDLADRYVALKVSTDLFGESQTLAQLQHTNIVPIYSIHHAPPFQAVCMPYFGSTTLADVLRILRGRQALPDSGKGLVSTLSACMSSTRRPGDPEKERHADSGTGRNGDSEKETIAPGPRKTAAGEVGLKLLEGFTFVEAVLWIGGRLADGLAHAHERGILHRDLKPANILLTEDGQPMLLDFNLSEDLKVRAGAPALIGGTLLYMAPEHLAAFQGGRRPIDGRSDLHALGVILFELLTGHRPFPTRRGPLNGLLTEMIADRSGPPPSVRRWNRAVSPAVESIVRQCLEPDPARRYQSARALHEDLERQLRHQPLRHAPEPSVTERVGKWARRHPRLASPASLASLAAALVFVVAATFFGWQQQRARAAEVEAQQAQERARTARAKEALDQFHHDRDEALFQLYAWGNVPEQLARGIAAGRAALARYGVFEAPLSWRELTIVQYLAPAEQEQLREEIADLLVLLARNQLLLRADDAQSADELLQVAESFSSDEREPGTLATRGQQARDHYVLAREHFLADRREEALRELDQATDLDPRHYWAWYVKSRCYFEMQDEMKALACLNTCAALWPDSHHTYYARATVKGRLHNYRDAVADFDQALRLLEEHAGTDRQRLADYHVDRALARRGLRDWAGALDDVNRALELGSSHTRLYFYRAEMHEGLAQWAEAERARQEGFRRAPSDDDSWTARGVARVRQSEALARQLRTCRPVLTPRSSGPLVVIERWFLDAALADFEHALECNPRSLAALNNKATVLSVHLHQVDEAIKVFDRAISYHPTSEQLLGSRGTLLARRGQREAALRDARACLQRGLDAVPGITLYQVAGIYALTSRQAAGDRDEALHLLARAFVRGAGLEHFRTDPDLNPLREDRGFRDLVHAVDVLHNVAKKRQP